MKKLFTLVVAGVAMLASQSVSAGIQPNAAKGSQKSVARPVVSHTGSASRALACDTLLNLDFSTADSNAVIAQFLAPNIGYISGTGALFGGGTTYFPITQAGEEYTTTLANSYVTSATAFFDVISLNPSATDSNLTVKAYVYDSTGTAAFGGYGLGTRPLDSASASMRFILANGAALFNFTHQAVLPGKTFFVMVAIPQITGDSIALVTNDGSTGRGKLWYNTPVGSVSLDSASHGQLKLGSYMLTTVCANQPGVGIADISGVSELSVYPNPSFGKVNVTFNMESASDIAISVTSITGSKVYEASEKAVSVYNKSLDLSSVAPGVYIVNIKTATGTINRRVSIQ